MKIHILTFFSAGFISITAFAQYYPNQVIIDSLGLQYRFHVTNETPKPYLSYLYYWFKSGKILETNGSYDGKLLHGEFKITDKDKHLLEQGSFRMGRKYGNWYTWYHDGKLKSVTLYRTKNDLQEIEEYNAEGTLIRKGSMSHNQFTGEQQERIKDSSFFVTYKNGIRQEDKNKRD